MFYYTLSTESAITTATSATPVAIDLPARPMGPERAVIIVSGADCFIKFGDDPVADETSALATVGTELAFTYGSAKKLSVRSVSGTGHITVYLI